ncbi:MAG TPA: CPBP family glutamic-type intramembrane protease [Actinomycetota bacterium]|nr:CPBP family glutamic-type intramembrane protease [Actinomycetota bacterium]
MDAVALAVAWAGPVIVAGAWAAIRLGGVSIWAAMGWTAGPLGLLSLLTGWVEPGGGLVVVPIGLGAGLVLYAATLVFLHLVRGWTLLTRHTREVYSWRRGMSLGAVVAIACLVVAPGEEALWRGLVQGRLAAAIGDGAAAAGGWALYVVANLASGSVPIVLGAAVGGAVWAALAFWTGGILAGVACHVVWTGLMILRPPVEEGPPG